MKLNNPAIHPVDRVRQLVWCRRQTPEEKHHNILKWTADTPLGRYTIRRYWKGGYIRGLKFDLDGGFFGGAHHWKLSEAKLCAQADFEARALECLEGRNQHTKT